MGSDESHFNVSLIVRDKVTIQCPETTTFEVKGEPKRIRTEVPLLTSLTTYRYTKPAHPLKRPPALVSYSHLTGGISGVSPGACANGKVPLIIATLVAIRPI